MGERVMKDRAKEAGTSCFLRFSCRQKTKGCACGSKKAAPMRRKDKPRGAALRSSAPHTGQAGRKEEGNGREWAACGPPIRICGRQAALLRLGTRPISDSCGACVGYP